jgi:hypothetical protein
MAGFTYATLTTAIQSYTEVGTTVLTSTITDQFIMNAEHRIMYDVPVDSDRKAQTGNLVTGQTTINAPAGAVFIRGVQVYDSTSVTTGANDWMLKRDQTFLQEYVPSTESAKRGKPKYYAMFGGATALTDTTSGRMMFAPVPDANYAFQVHYNLLPTGLSSGNTTTYISNYFPQGLLYCCLAEAYGYLKGPMDMLTLYENKYKQEVEKFAGMQIGRRRRDDYTDGTVRIPIESPPQ